MITSVYIDGLKSLNNFNLELNPGLNVLVGPNGSGKSNILIAFELISYLNRLDYLNKIEVVGSTRISDLFDNHRSEKSINIKLEGKFRLKKKAGRELQYEYECKIVHNPEIDNELKFAHQSLQLFDKQRNESEQIFYVYFGGDSSRYGGHKLKEFFEELFGGKIKSVPSEENNLEEFFKIYYRYENKILYYRSIINELSLYFENFQVLSDELESMKLFNIDPEKIRHSMEKKVAPKIDRDGSRLSSVLLEIWKFKDFNKAVTDHMDFPRINFNSTHKNIIGYLKQLSAEFVDINIYFNEDTNKIESEVILKGKGRKNKKLRLELMSDGTLKWLSLVTAILTTKNMFIMEEPENYLNSSMQLMFTDLVRSSVENRNNFGLFSTHSQTIMDSLKPEEIVITFFRDGSTHVTRIENIKLLNEVLSGSGNGLGWYFATHSLDPDSNGKVLPMR